MPKRNLKNMTLWLITLLFLNSSCNKAITYGGFPNPGPNLPFTPDDMVTAFKQGIAGNCASIAVIKSAILHYKKNCENIYVSALVEFDGTVKVKLRDGGGLLTITKSERKEAEEASAFVLGTNKEVFDEARLVFAILCKKKQLTKSGSSIQAAAKALNGGERLDYNTIIDLLCLKAYLKDITTTQPSEFARYNNLIIGNKYHAAFSSNGYYDEYGTKTLVSEFSDNHRKFYNRGEITGAYSFN